MTLLTAQETAGLLRISLTGLWRLQAQKKIRMVKVGGKRLFDRTDLERFVAENKFPHRIPKI